MALAPPTTMSPPAPPSEVELRPGLTLEDHGTEFYLISEGDGHDLTLSLEVDIARAIAQFIDARLRTAPR